MDLYEQVINSKPMFDNNEDALKYFTEQLEAVCSKNGKSVEEFLLLAEYSKEYNQDMVDAMNLARNVHYFIETINAKSKT